MSSVQGPQQVTRGALDRIRTQLDMLNATSGISNTGALVRLKEQLEKNVVNGDTASDLAGKLSEDQRKVLARHVQAMPQVREFFKDSIGHLYSAGTDVNSRDFGKARSVRAQAGSTGRVSDGQMVTPASLKNKTAGEPVGATSGAAAKRSAEPTKARPVEQPAKADGQDGVAQAPSAAAKGQATGPRRVNIIDDETPVTGGAQQAQQAKAAGATSADGIDDVAGAEKVAGPEADGAQTASGATPMPPSIDEIYEGVIAQLHAIVDPEATAWHERAETVRSQLTAAGAEIGFAEQRLNELKAIPAKDRTPEQKAEIAQFGKYLKANPSTAQVQKRLEEINAQIQETPSKVGLLNAYYGLKQRVEGEPDRPGRAMDPKSREGRETLAILDEIFGRNSDLPPEMKAKIAEFRKTPEGKQILEIQPSLDLNDAVRNGRVKMSPDVLDLMGQLKDGKLVSEDAVRKVLGMPSKEEEEVAAKATAGGGGGAVPPGGGGGGAGVGGPGSGGSPDQWFNASNKNWFGLSRVRHDQLKNDGHNELLQAITDYNVKKQTMHMSQTTRLHSMMSLLNSGLPIESILLMFMGLMTENEEEKLKLKMAEIVVGEQFERTNSKLAADQNFARDLHKKYGLDGVAAEQRENLNKEQIEKMAGVTWTPSVTPEEASRDNARGRLFESMRAQGVGKDKLEKLTFKDGKLDPEAVKELGLDPVDLEKAGIKDEAALETFKIKAADLSDDDIGELKLRKAVQSEVRFVDVTLNPSDFGFTSKPSQALVQELQVQMQNYKQIMETFTAVIRMLQDIVSRITQNIR